MSARTSVLFCAVVLQDQDLNHACMLPYCSRSSGCPKACWKKYCCNKSLLWHAFSLEFCPAVRLRLFESIFQVYDYLLLLPFNEHYIPHEEPCAQEDGERCVIRQKPIHRLGYSYNCSLNLPSIPSCHYTQGSFPVAPFS